MTTDPTLYRPESPMRVHIRVVNALLRREMSTRYGRASGGYFWVIAEPCAAIFVMSLVWAAMDRGPDLGQSFIVFFATGFLSFNFYRLTAGQLFSAVKGTRALLKYPNVNVYDAIIARFILQTLTNCFICVLVLGVAIVWTDEQVILDFSKLLPSLVAASMLALGVGTVNATLFMIYPTWERVFQIVNRPLFIISGVLYIPEIMPGAIREVLGWNPLVHVVSTFREGVYGYYDPVHDNLWYPALIGVVLFFFGLLLLRRHDEDFVEQ